MSSLWRRNCLYQVQVAGLALHALEPDEEIDVLDHLQRCPSCQAALRDAERVLGGLGASIELVEPPAALRGAILAEAAETMQVSSPDSPPFQEATDEIPAPIVAAAERFARHRPSVPVPPVRRGLSRRGGLVAASLVLAGLVAVGALGVQSAQLAEQRDAQVAQAQTLAEIVTRLDQPGSRHATLATAEGRAVAAVVVLDGQRTLVTSGDLAPNAVDRDTYVVWGLGSSGPQAIGTFDVVAAVTDVRTVGPEVPTDRFSGYAISIEQGRVAPVSPSTVVASGKLDT